jgi:hypothetical protein
VAVTSLFCKIRPTSLARTSPIHSLEMLPTTSLLSSVTESTPCTLTLSPHPALANPRAPPSSSIQESLWAPTTDGAYESSILAASPSVQSIYFPEPQASQEPRRLSTIDESPSSESPYHSLFLSLVTFSNADSNCIRVITSVPSTDRVTAPLCCKFRRPRRW